MFSLKVLFGLFSCIENWEDNKVEEYTGLVRWGSVVHVYHVLLGIQLSFHLFLGLSHLAHATGSRQAYNRAGLSLIWLEAPMCAHALPVSIIFMF